LARPSDKAPAVRAAAAMPFPVCLEREVGPPGWRRCIQKMGSAQAATGGAATLAVRTTGCRSDDDNGGLAGGSQDLWRR
jgi:hypothetical protein